LDANARMRPPSRPGSTCDAIVIGGGFYGCEIALELVRLGFEKVVLVEREPGLLRRASFVNQARIHNGYHYPRAYLG
jgi:glycine/D-amino acid oxidase-like deaminating enzyme